MLINTKSRIVGGLGVLAAVAVALGVTMAPAVTAVDDQQTTPSGDQVRIGTYDPEMIFQQYHGMGELIAMSQRIQQEFQEAQMQGDQQRLMQLQQQMQQEQMRIITQFQEDVERVVPDIAKSIGLEIVAVELTYVAEGIGEPQDISQQIIEKVNESAPETDQEQPQESSPEQSGQPGNAPE